jgi:hypothetical protein
LVHVLALGVNWRQQYRPTRQISSVSKRMLMEDLATHAIDYCHYVWTVYRFL